jgi:hypothetical protein
MRDTRDIRRDSPQSLRAQNYICSYRSSFLCVLNSILCKEKKFVTKGRKEKNGLRRFK